MNAEITENNLQENPHDLPDRYWWIGCLLITAVAIFLRVYLIELKPFHHDEGVNGFFLTNLFRGDIYKYDPGNYHGPTLYFISLAFAKLLGLETFAVRYSTAIFGVGIVVLAFCLRRYLGKIGTLCAGLFLALSPGMVFVSRYFIHEILFVFFTFGVVVGVLYFIEKDTSGIWANVLMALLLLICIIPLPLLLPGQLAHMAPGVFGDMQGAQGTVLRSILFLLEAAIVFVLMLFLSRWREGRPIYLILASASCALVFATKETAFISFGTMLIAFVCIWIYLKLFVDPKRLEETWEEPVELTTKSFVKSLGIGADSILLISATAFIFIYVNILFFSSFFTFFPEGVSRAFEAYQLWTKTGTKDHADKSRLMYVYWMARLEAPIFSLGGIGAVLSFWIAQHRFAMFTALWGFGLMAAYTIIPYKTPWLALSFILPVCLIAGYAINEIAVRQKAVAAILAVIAAGILLYQTIDLNFYKYDDESQSYVYVQTKREFLGLIKKIDVYAEKTGKGNDLSIAIVSKDYWPMPWYVNKYPKAIFHGEPVPANMADLIITSQEQESTCAQEEYTSPECKQLKHYADNYEQIGTYPLRPAVDLNIYARNDVQGKPLNIKKAETADQSGDKSEQK